MRPTSICWWSTTIRPTEPANGAIKQAAIDPRVHCLHRTGKLGLGTAIVAGLKYGIEHGYKYVVNLDADFSHPPRNLPAMIGGMDPAASPPIDVMIGSRYVPGGGIEGWPLKRHLMSRGVNLYARWLLWLAPKDCSGGYRCYRTATLERRRFRPHPFARLFVSRRNLVAAPPNGRPIRRNPDHFCRSGKGKFEDQLERSRRGTADHSWIGNAESARTLFEPQSHKRCPRRQRRVKRQYVPSSTSRRLQSFRRLGDLCDSVVSQH